MNERDKETIKLIATILGNVAAIAIGVALIDKSQEAAWIALTAAVMAYMSIRSIR